MVDYRALNEVLETQYPPPPEWSNIVNQLGDSELHSTFDCADFFFQNRLRRRFVDDGHIHVLWPIRMESLPTRAGVESDRPVKFPRDKEHR